MNFAHYYSILQQIEKPTFVFDRFENKEIIKLDVDNFGDYLLINENKITFVESYLLL
jgi:hypothetical protein